MLGKRKHDTSSREAGRNRRGISHLPFLLLALLYPPIALTAPPPPGDVPEILVEPPEVTGISRDVIVRASVHDPDGVGSVTVWARGEKEAEFAGYPMESTGAGTWTGRVPPAPTRGRTLSYFVEATDRLGNGPGRSGSPVEPLVAELDALSPSAAHLAAANRWRWFYWTLLALCGVAGAFLLRVLLTLRGKRGDHGELDFWCNLLSPLSDKTGSELSRRVDRLCASYHDHPKLGRIRLKREEVLLWLGTIRRCEPERLYLMRRMNREFGDLGRRDPTATPTPVHREVADEAFWRDMLAPLTHLPRAEAASAIRDLCNRPHVHPTQGIITPDAKALRDRLRQVAESRPEPAETSTPRNSAGASLPELLVVVAIVGLVAGAATLYLKPMEAPVRSAAVLVEGLVKQTRARSMSTTSSYRVRPFGSHELVVEYATNCSEMAWTLDPRMDLELPAGVTVSPTDWSVCFNSRGTASDNVVLVLDHPNHQAQSLEILMGGAVRWQE